MSFDELVGRSQQILTLIALGGAIWSAVSFVISKSRERKLRDYQNLLIWRKAAIQELMMLSPDWLTTKDVLGRLRSDVFEQGFEIDKSALDERSVRHALMELVRDGILYQVHGDKYGINQVRFDPGAEINAELLVNHRAAMAAIGLIHEYPDHYDDAALFQKIRDNGHEQLTVAGFRASLYDAARRGIVSRSDAGKWSHTAPVANEG